MRSDVLSMFENNALVCRIDGKQKSLLVLQREYIIAEVKVDGAYDPFGF
jgi:hypothetical protein